LKALQSEDSFNVYGKHIAHKLRGLKGRQNVFAQKPINAVLFEAEIEALTEDFKIINCGKNREPYYWRSTGAPSGEQLLDLSQGFPHPPPAGPTGTFFQQPATVNACTTRAETPCLGTSGSASLSHFFSNFDVNHSCRFYH
jgi:hypothetical protein